MTSVLSLSPERVDWLYRELAAATEGAEAVVSGLPPSAPLHVVYGGAHLFQAGTAEKLGARARQAMTLFGSDARLFGRAVGIDGDDALAHAVAERVTQKLERHPVEAMCIDFED